MALFTYPPTCLPTYLPTYLMFCKLHQFGMEKVIFKGGIRMVFWILELKSSLLSLRDFKR